MARGELLARMPTPSEVLLFVDLDALGGNHDPHAYWHGRRPRARARLAVTYAVTVTAADTQYGRRPTG
jgi:hypothetical protein